jgi:hypothetical protein
MVVKKPVLELLARTLLYSLIIILINFVIIFAIIFALQGELNQITRTLSFALLFEGGIGLTAGGAAAFYSPLGAKISEVFFHSKPWNAKRQKEVEKQAIVWIATAIFLVFVALLLSAV